MFRNISVNRNSKYHTGQSTHHDIQTLLVHQRDYKGQTDQHRHMFLPRGLSNTTLRQSTTEKRTHDKRVANA